VPVERKFSSRVTTGAAPGVDGLVDVADNTYIAVGAGKGVGQLELDEVGVLEFVDENVAETVPEPREGFRMLPEQQEGVIQQVVKVHASRVFERLLIGLVDSGDGLAAVIGGLCRVILRC